MSKNMNRITTYKFLSLALICFLSSCAPIGNYKSKQLSIDEISGVWESTFVGYVRMVINKNGTGYVISIENENSYDISIIKSIDINSNDFTINYCDINDKDCKQEQILCGLVGTKLAFVEFHKDGQSKKNEPFLFFIRESEFNSSRVKSISIIHELNLKD